MKWLLLLVAIHTVNIWFVRAYKMNIALLETRDHVYKLPKY